MDVEFFLAHVDSVGVGQQGQVGSVVHHEQHAGFTRPSPDAMSQFEQIRVGQRLVSQLHDADTPVGGCPDRWADAILAT